MFWTLRSVAISLMLGLVFGQIPARADVLFFDDFNGPTMNPVWQSSLPTLSGFTYLGAPPNAGFQSLNGASVLRLTNSLNNLQQIGWSTAASFDPTSFRLDVRFNTLVQSSSTSIDGFVQSWLIDASQPSRYVMASPFEGGYSANPVFNVRGTIDSSGTNSSFNFINNTWYHLVIQGSSTQNIRASIYADDNVTELIGYSLDYSAATAFPGGFRIGLGQYMGTPNRTAQVDVAVDYVSLTGAAVPEPSPLLLGGLGASVLGTLLCWKRRGE